MRLKQHFSEATLFKCHPGNQLDSKQKPPRESPTESIDAQLVDEIPKSLDDILDSFLTFAL